MFVSDPFVADLVPAGLCVPMAPISREEAHKNAEGFRQVALPQIKGQCAHVQRIWSKDGASSYMERCLEDSFAGWLCKKHQAETHKRKRPAPKTEDELAQDVVDHIHIVETKALLNGLGRETISGITSLKGVRMTSDPEPYYQDYLRAEKAQKARVFTERRAKRS